MVYGREIAIRLKKMYASHLKSDIKMERCLNALTRLICTGQALFQFHQILEWIKSSKCYQFFNFVY